MLDWFTGVTAFDTRYMPHDVIYRVSPMGDIKWSKDCYFEAKGSWEDKMLLRSVSNCAVLVPTRDGPLETTELLQLSGNPTKFLQGHNAFGVSVLEYPRLVLDSIKALPPEVCPVDPDLERTLIVRKSRIDIAVMVDMGSHEDVHYWLQSVSGASRSRHGRAQISGSSVYWGLGSRRWMLKAYCKYCEMYEHGMADRAHNDLVRQYVKNQLRLELTLRGHELEGREALNEDILWSYFDRIKIGVLDMDRVKELDKLPLSSQAVVLKWLKGEPVRMQMTKPTFYRHRMRILESLGVDISIAALEQQNMLEHKRYATQYLKDHEIKTLPGELEFLVYRPRQLVMNLS